MNHRRATLAAPVLRRLERLLPVPTLLAALRPVAWVRAVVHRAVKGPDAPPARPPWLTAGAACRPVRLPRRDLYLDRTLEHFPDRLARPEWRARCRVAGLGHLPTPGAGVGAVLAFVHAGPYRLLRGWLRAFGVPASMLVRGAAVRRGRFQRRTDAWSRFPEIPPAFHQDELADAIRHLRAGRPLAVAVDVDTGRQLTLPRPGGWCFTMATGAIRLARRHGAPLLACALRREGDWRYALELSEPVPAAAWAAGDAAVGAWLLERLLPGLRRHPEQASSALLARARPARP